MEPSRGLAILALLASAGLGCSDDLPPSGRDVGISPDSPGAAILPVNDPRPPCNGPMDVRAYGAVGDGVQDDTIAIQLAIDTCAKDGGIAVASPGTYHVGPLFLRTNLTLELDSGSLLQGTSDMGQYVAAASQNGGAVPSLINATNVNNIKITGSGIIDGAGAPWWAAQNAASAAGQPDPFRPLLMDIKNVNGFTMENVTLRNSPKFHVLLESSVNITITGVTITAPSNSPNTDGIDPKTCKHVMISGCNISVGDDNVAVTSAGNPSPTASDVTVTGCTFGAGHGVSIGSYTSGGVGSMTVQHCTFTGTQNGIRIKTARDRGGDIANLVYDDLQMTNVRNAIYFTEYYPDIPMPGTDTAAIVTFTTPSVHDVTISNITATGTRSAGVLIGVPESVVHDINLENVNIQAQNGLTVRNATGIHFSSSSITVTGATATPLVMQENAVVDGL
jgi:polygalacturonase